ncbi:hypothetical protein BGZ63DRAFT_388939 [Mariannaea sp. PMI_226]|nr:hypothetical protein BGZ63DRAFT_388939 [Mariannaea sp. PMI_226]
MTQSLNTYDKIAIAEIVIYTFLFGGSIFLCARDGIRKSSGWRFLVVLSLARLIGSALLLATVNDPSNESLYIGWLTLNGVGFGPLILMLVALIGRLIESINRQSAQPIVKPLYQRLIEILMLAALILLVIGGTSSKYTFVNGVPKINYTVESKVGAILFIVVMAFLLLQTIVVLRHQGYIAQGDYRILVAVLASIPFVIVRLVYTVYLILGNKTTTVWLYLGAGVIMEMFVCIICEVVGFTLKKVSPKTNAPENEQAPYNA